MNKKLCVFICFLGIGTWLFPTFSKQSQFLGFSGAIILNNPSKIDSMEIENEKNVKTKQIKFKRKPSGKEN